MDYPTFKKLAGELTGIDLANYKSTQMDRRINSLKQSWNLETYDDFLAVLKTDSNRYKEFVKKLTINVSEFFRNPERFIELWQQILPELLAKRPIVRVWSAGCSNGAEPYSIAIIANEMHVADRVQILATDVDHEILEKARQAVYIPNEVRSLPPDLLTKYFTYRNDLYYLNEEIKRRIRLDFHNLLLDPFETNLDLIICRNVVIYFTEAAKNNLYGKFWDALRPGGYLLVGGTEPLLQYRQMGFENPLTSFYKKPE